MKHSVQDGFQAPALQAVQRLRGVSAGAGGAVKAVARLAGQEGIAQQIEAMAIPFWIPVECGGSAGND